MCHVEETCGRWKVEDERTKGRGSGWINKGGMRGWAGGMWTGVEGWKEEYQKQVKWMKVE